MELSPWASSSSLEWGLLRGGGCTDIKTTSPTREGSEVLCTAARINSGLE